MEDRSAIITLRIEPGLKKAFEQLTASMDRTPSQMLRGYIRHAVQQYAEEHAQGELELPTSPTPAPKKPKKGQRLATACANSVRKP